MTGNTLEETLNVALGEVLAVLRPLWKVRSERTGNVLVGGGRPDILIEESSGWPVAIEAERTSHANADKDAIARLGRMVAQTGKEIESTIALVYPSALHTLDGEQLRRSIRECDDLQFALFTRRLGENPLRLPKSGWMTGTVRDLAIAVTRASIPQPRIERLATDFENGVKQAADFVWAAHRADSQTRVRMAEVLGQADDDDGQTRRMAMTVISTALVFHESLAEVDFLVPPGNDGRARPVRPVQSFQDESAFLVSELCDEWERILEVNYWPIFWSAKEMVNVMPTRTATEVLNILWRTGQLLVAGGVTRSHDLMGIVFQNLIADRKFLATEYTSPEAAALLAALALPEDAPPGGSSWDDSETLASVQIGDFACGTGTLLSAAYSRMSLMHELYGGDAEALHAPMMKHGLVGLDVLPIAVHLTAAMLAGSHPSTPFEGECLLAMPYAQDYVVSNGKAAAKQ